MKETRPYRRLQADPLELLLWLALFAWVAPAALAANPRGEILETLVAIDASGSDAGLEVWMNDARGRADDVQSNRAQLGSPMRIRATGTNDRELLAVAIDAHGVVQVFAVDAEDDGADAPLILDAVATPPLGATDLFVFATREPLALRGFELAPETPLIADSERAVALAKELSRALRAQSNVSVARLQAFVYGRGSRTRSIGGAPAPQYNKADVIDYFTSTRTRSVASPSLDVSVRFEFGEDTLSPEARANLDVIGDALTDSRIARLRFEILGHTDDVGDEHYNMDLSNRRAQAVRRYLMAEHGVDPGRLTIEGRGETEPLVSDDSPEARKMNRRVEFSLLRE